MAEKAITWYNRLKEAINGQIKKNGKREITGARLNSVLNQMVDALGKNMTFGGVVSPATLIDNTDDNPVFYLALVAGNYPYCGNIVVGQGQIAFLFRDANNIWHQASWNAPDENFTTEEKEKLQGLPTEEQLREAFGAKANAPESKPGSDNLASFDKDGNLKDSGVSIPVPTEEEKEHVLSSGETGLKWVPKPVDGKSALDIYNDLNPNARLDEAGFIAKLQQKYPMKHAAYYSEAVSKPIGTPFIGAIDNEELLPTFETMGNLYIMPNDDPNPTGSVAFTTINTGVDEYKWVNLGPVDVPYNALTEEMVDNKCSDGAINKPASAKAVMDLKAKLYGNLVEEKKIQLVEHENYESGFYVKYDTTNGHCISESKKEKPDDIPNAVCVINVEGYNKIRFLGCHLTNTDTSTVGYGFCEEEPAIEIDYPIDVCTPFTSGAFVNAKKEYIIDIPEDKKYFVCTIRCYNNVIMSINDYYCYLQRGLTVNDIYNDSFIPDENSTVEPVQTQNSNYIKLYTTTFWFSGNYKTVVYPVNKSDNFYFLNKTTPNASNCSAVYTSTKDLTFATQGNLKRISGAIGFQKIKHGDKLDIPDGAMYVCISGYKVDELVLCKGKNRIDAIDERFGSVDDEIDAIKSGLISYEHLGLYDTKTNFYVYDETKVGYSTNYKLVVFDIQGGRSLKFSTEIDGVYEYKAIYVSDIDFSNLKNSMGRYTVLNTVGSQVYSNGDYLVVPDGAKYVILSYKYKNTDNPNPVFVSEPSSVIESFGERLNALEHNSYDKLPAYYDDFLEDRCKKIVDLIASDFSGYQANDSNIPSGWYKDAYLFVTDIHYPSNNNMAGRVMAEVVRRTPIKRAINGGDICGEKAVDFTGVTDPMEGIRRIIALSENDMNKVVDAGAEYFQMKGNHDFSLKERTTGNYNENKVYYLPNKEVFSYLMAKNAANPNVVYGQGTGDSCCFYKDYIASKLRYIFLDTVDSNRTVRTTLAANTNNSMYETFTDAQFKWFAETVTSTPADFNIVVLSHHYLDVASYINTAKFSEFYNTHHRIVDLINAVNSGSVYDFGNQQYDFSAFSPKILMHHCGHFHSDRVLYCGYWEIVQASAHFNSDHKGFEQFYFGVDNNANMIVANTVKETLFDAVVIDNHNASVSGENDYCLNLVRIGPGCDRVVHMKEIIIDNNEGPVDFTPKLVQLADATDVQWKSVDTDNKSRNVDDTTDYAMRFRCIHGYMDNNGLFHVGRSSEEEPDSNIVSNYGDYSYTPNLSISGYVTVYAYSAELNIMEIFGVKVIAED